MKKQEVEDLMAACDKYLTAEIRQVPDDDDIKTLWPHPYVELDDCTYQMLLPLFLASVETTYHVGQIDLEFDNRLYPAHAIMKHGDDAVHWVSVNDYTRFHVREIVKEICMQEALRRRVKWDDYCSEARKFTERLGL